MPLDLARLDAIIARDLPDHGDSMEDARTSSNSRAAPRSRAPASSYALLGEAFRDVAQSGAKGAVAADDSALRRPSLLTRNADLIRSTPCLHGRRAKAPPRNTAATWDMETLQELVMSYKRKVSDLEKGRRLLRAQYQNAQERVAAKDREIDAILQRVAGGAALASEKSLIRSLKQQIRLVQQQRAETRTELERLRADVKFTQLEEMRIYCDDFAQELRRLLLFNELGRTAQAHVTISALEEIRTLRHQCSALTRDNAALANKLTQAELGAEQARSRDRSQFADRIQKMEAELGQERALVGEMEKIGDITRAELAQVLSQTDTTRVALSDASDQIRVLRERIAAQDAEIQSLNATAVSGAEKSGRDVADLLALKDSMEKLMAELGDAQSTIERQRAENSTLRESERLLQDALIDLRRVCEENELRAMDEQRRLLDQLQQRRQAMVGSRTAALLAITLEQDAIGDEKKTAETDLATTRAELEQSVMALRRSQESYEQAKDDVAALENLLFKAKVDAEQAASVHAIELAQHEAELQEQEQEVARLHALNEENATRDRTDLGYQLGQHDAHAMEAPGPSAAKPDIAVAETAEAGGDHRNNAADRGSTTQPDSTTPDGSEPAAAATVAVIGISEPPSGGSREVTEERDSVKRAKKDRDRRVAKPTPDNDRNGPEKGRAERRKGEQKPDKDKVDQISNKTEKRGEKKPSSKRVGSREP